MEIWKKKSGKSHAIFFWSKTLFLDFTLNEEHYCGLMQFMKWLTDLDFQFHCSAFPIAIPILYQRLWFVRTTIPIFSSSNGIWNLYLLIWLSSSSSHFEQNVFLLWFSFSYEMFSFSWHNCLITRYCLIIHYFLYQLSLECHTFLSCQVLG